VGFAGAVAYRSEMLIWLLSTNTPLIMMLLWTAVAAEGPMGRFGQAEFVAYFLATLVVRLLTGAWVAWEMNAEIRQGQMAGRLLKPLHPFVAYAAENFAAWPLRLLMVLPIGVVAFATVGRAALTHDARQLALVPLTLLGAWAITFCAMLTIGSLSFFWESTMSLMEVWMAMYVTLSGYIVPLELFPRAVAEVIAVLPFPFLLSFPVENLLGLISWEESLARLAVQWCYVAAFLTLATVTWRAGVRRYEAFGG
jgi:ABC-2 type transport system permease protein